MLFRDPARARFSSRKRTAIIPAHSCRYPRLKVYPHFPHRPPPQTLLQNTP